MALPGLKKAERHAPFSKAKKMSWFQFQAL
jgi:hypothetical protein